MRMWSRRAILVGGAVCVLAACRHGQAGSIPYSVAVSGDGNEVLIDTYSIAHAHGYIVSVRSDRGIGEASIAWWGSSSPHHLAFHLNLSGLEHFRLSWTPNAVNISVNSTDDSVRQWTQSRGSSEDPISPDSPYWMNVARHAQGRQGYMLTVPPAFLADAPRLWAIAWVDFFR